MPSWTEVHEYLESKYKIADRKENWIKMVFSYDNDQHLQTVILSTFSAYNRAWLDISSNIQVEKDYGPQFFLRRNYAFAFGHICTTEEGLLIFRHELLLKTLDNADFELFLHGIPGTAYALKKELE